VDKWPPLLRLTVTLGTLGIVIVAAVVVSWSAVDWLRDLGGESGDADSQVLVTVVTPTPTIVETVRPTSTWPTVRPRETRRLTPLPPRPTRTPTYDLELVSFSCYQTASGSFQQIEGFVKNVSQTALENVEAVGIFEDANGVPISSDSALVDYDPILPGQTSPFSVIARRNPAINWCKISFKEFFGGTFSTNYDNCVGCSTR